MPTVITQQAFTTETTIG